MRRPRRPRGWLLDTYSALFINMDFGGSWIFGIFAFAAFCVLVIYEMS
jgi:hypothetical protein